MLSVSGELTNISHPLVRSLHIRQEFDVSRESRKILVLEAAFSFGKDTGKESQIHLMNLLAELEHIAALAEQAVGRFDCIDIEPARSRPMEAVPRFAA